MNRIGFCGRSLYDMETSWKGIEALHFFCANPRVDFVDSARCWYEAGNQATLSDALKAHFGARVKWVEQFNAFVIDDLLSFRIDDRKHFLEVRAQPSRLKAWEEPEFALAKEIDKVLQKVALPNLPKPYESASFFRGKVVDDLPRFYEMESDWKGVEVLHFFEHYWGSGYARCWYESGPSTATVLIDAINAHFGSRVKIVTPNRYGIDDLLYLNLEENSEFLELRFEPSENKVWKAPESTLAREIDEVLQKVPLRTLPKPYSEPSFFRGKVVEGAQE